MSASTRASPSRKRDTSRSRARLNARAQAAKTKRLRSRDDFGMDNHVTGDVRSKSEAPAAVVKRQVAEAIVHLKQVEGWWNTHAAAHKVPVRMNASKTIKRLENGDYNFFLNYFSRLDDSGVLHETQIITTIKIIRQFLDEPDKMGLVLGALQAGKTLTAIAIQWLGPVNYLVTGKKVRLIYLITNYTSHEDQTKHELGRFLSWYGDIELVRVQKRISLNNYAKKNLLPYFESNPTLNTYRDEVLRGSSYGDTLVDQGNFVNRRVQGQQVDKIAVFCGKMYQDGIESVLILDEFQYGAGDPVTLDESTGTRRRCVLRQILDAISEQIEGQEARYIAFSATPFPLFDVSSEELPNVWRVHLALSTAYVGFNFFGGTVICDGVKIRTPNYLGFTNLGDEIDSPLLSDNQFSAAMWLLAHNPKITDYDRADRFERWAKRHHYAGSLDDYISDFQRTMFDIIDHCVDQAPTTGICIRLGNQNDLTDEFIEAMHFDPKKIEVLKFFRQSSHSVKRFIHENRKCLDLPYIIFVTSKARMGDAFPAEVNYFIECTEKASTLNALLQGLLGRACGYGKDTTVFMSDHNATVVQEWVDTEGGHVYPGCAHTIPVKMRRGPRSNMVKLTSDMDDPIVQKFFALVETKVVRQHLVWRSQPKLTAKTRSSVGRTAPLLQLADKVGLFEHLENPEVVARLFPNVHGTLRIARKDETVNSRNRKGDRIAQRYHQDNRGWVGFTFRHSESARGGRAGRGLHTEDTSRDSRTDRARVGGRLDPQINVEKYDPKTGIAFDDRKEKTRRNLTPGDWRAHMITFPLLRPVREIEIAEAQLPNRYSPFDKRLTDDQRVDRNVADGIVTARKAARAARRVQR